MNREDKEFRERIKVNTSLDTYPFDAEEMLLNAELRDMKKRKEKSNKPKAILGDNSFEAEEMLLNAELREMDEGR